MLNYSANGPSGYNLTNSLRVRRNNSAYLNRTFSTPTSNYIWTWSAWVKRGSLGTDQSLFGVAAGSSGNTGFTPRGAISWDAGDTFSVFANDGSSTTLSIVTTQVFRDPSAWYHIVVAVDTTQATAANRVKLYVNGNQVTSLSTATYYPQNATTIFNGTGTSKFHAIGMYANLQQFLDGYLTENNFIDGQALTPSSFGNTNSTTGVWQPAKYTGTYGTNGFYLNFTDIALTSGSNAGLGKDFSGNGNYWTTNNISVTAGTTYDAMTDVPTLTSATVANYCTWNPLYKITGTVSNGNLTLSGSDLEIWGTMAFPTSGSYYYELTVGTTGGGGFGPQIGITSFDGNYTVKYFRNGYKGVNGTNTAYGGAWAVNDVIGIAYNASTNTVTFYKNNVSQGDITATSGQIYAPYAFDNASGIGSANFGQRPFAYTPPTGYVALNTFNLPSSTILQGNKYMDATLYTGNGSTQTITNAGSFKPDLVWVKSRSNAYNNVLNDSVRGSTKLLISNGTDAEQTEAQSITSFNSNGFSLGTAGTWNQNASTFVGWQWQAGQGSTSSNTAGTITSTTSVNASAGFSVVTYTGTGANATVGHGLGVAPRMMLFKNRTSAIEWQVYHASIGNGQYGVLNSTAAFATSGIWQNTTPTSSVFSIASGFSGVNTNSSTYVAYCWAEIAGFSAFGSYTGNGSTDGPFVYTGFRPKYVLIKRSSGLEYWYILDSVRNTYNPEDKWLVANATDSEGTTTFVDFLSNGFKVRAAASFVNSSGVTFIYACFAENPFKNALAR